MKKNYLTISVLFAVLILFNGQQVCACEGCTLTLGYWKTHTKYDGPKADATWSLIGGEECGFWESGQNFYQVLWTAPKGNAYYILAHQFIAAQLNLFKDNWLSATSEVVDAMTDGVALFEVYTPEQVADLKKSDRKTYNTFITLSKVLDEFNNGIIGPGHCDDIKDKSIAMEITPGIIETDMKIQNYPNPFDSFTSFSFVLAERSDVKLTILNLSGQKIEIVEKGIYPAGTHTINWLAPQDMNPGFYLYQLKAGNTNIINKMLKK